MENEPQYLFLETECSARVYEWVGGKGKLTDEQQEQQTSRQDE